MRDASPEMQVPEEAPSPGAGVVPTRETGVVPSHGVGAEPGAGVVPTQETRAVPSHGVGVVPTTFGPSINARPVLALISGLSLALGSSHTARSRATLG
jgi:hypothetical protein